VHVVDWPTGVGAGGRPLVLEDLVQLHAAGVESAVQRRITDIFDRVRPDPAWSLDFVRGKTGRMLVDPPAMLACWWLELESTWAWVESCSAQPATTV
jgi:hypothetical protein